MIISNAVLKAGASLFAIDDVSILRAIGGGAAADGAVYAYEQDGQGYVIKYIPCVADRLLVYQDKTRFVNYLRDNGVNTPRQFPSTRGELVELVELIEVDGTTYAVSKAEKVDGHPPNPFKSEHWDTRFFRGWGRIIGQMHALTQNYEGGDHVGHWHEEHAVFVDWCKDDAVREKWRAFADVLGALPQSADCYGLIHNDPHPFNFLRGGDMLTVIDFDVCSHHWFIMDLAIALFQPLWPRRDQPPKRLRAFARKLYDGLMSGYEAANHLDPFWLKQLPTFMRYRRALFYIALSNDEHPDAWSVKQLPALRQAILEDEPLPALEDWSPWEVG